MINCCFYIQYFYFDAWKEAVDPFHNCVSSVLVNDYSLYYLGFSPQTFEFHWSSLLTYQYFNVALLTFDCNWQYYQPSHPHKVQWMYQLKHLHNIKALWLRNSAQPKSLDVVKCILNGHNFPMLIIWWIRAIHIL